MFCPHCGRENPDDAHNCVSCGAKLPELDGPDEFALRVADIARRDGKIAAVKYVRSELNCGLKEAKDEVEAILNDLDVNLPKAGCLGMLLAAVTFAGTAHWMWG